MNCQLDKIAQQIEQQNKPELAKWNPKTQGEIDIVVKADGTWWHEGTEFQRIALVKMFASILIYEDGDYWLKTPVEKMRIQVESAPFIVTEWEIVEGHLIFTTNLQQQIILSEQFPLYFPHSANAAQVEIPQLKMEHGLSARLHRNVYYQLVEQAQLVETENHHQAWLQSGDYRFCLGEFQ